MALHWIPPPQGALKINVHGVSSAVPLPNGNNNGIGAIYRDQNGGLKHITIGVIPDLTPLGNQLWAIYAPMRRAFEEGYRDIFIETDNYEAFKIIRDFNLGAPASVYEIVDQISTLLYSHRWMCSTAYVYPARNRVARYAAMVGMESSDRLYTLDRSVAGIEELLDWDLGLGFVHPDYIDVVVPHEAPDPVNFVIGVSIADQVNELGLGHINAPQMANPNIYGNVNQNGMHGTEPNGGEDMQEQVVYGSHGVNNGHLFEGDPADALYSNEPPIDDLD